MAKTRTITLGETEYTIRPLTIDELERVTDVFKSQEPGKVPFEVVKIALLRAEPKVENPGSVEADIDQVRVAMQTYLELGGLVVPAADPPVAATAAA